jgi:hypothetical protein
VPYIRPVDVTDIISMAPRLRDADKQEILASSGSNPLDALRFAVASSHEVWVGCDDEGPQAIYGVMRLSTGEGSVWLLGTDRLKLHVKFFLRESRRWLKEKEPEYPVLRALIDSRNTLHLRWCAWCGFLATGNKYRLKNPSVDFIEIVR